MQVDLTGAEVIDAHCHPFRTGYLLDRDPRTFETRCMFLGTALISLRLPTTPSLGSGGRAHRDDDVRTGASALARATPRM